MNPTRTHLQVFRHLVKTVHSQTCSTLHDLRTLETSLDLLKTQSRLFLDLTIEYEEGEPKEPKEPREPYQEPFDDSL